MPTRCSRPVIITGWGGTTPLLESGISCDYVWLLSVYLQVALIVVVYYVDKFDILFYSHYNYV